MLRPGSLIEHRTLKNNRVLLIVTVSTYFCSLAMKIHLTLVIKPQVHSGIKPFFIQPAISNYDFLTTDNNEGSEAGILHNSHAVSRVFILVHARSALDWL